MITYIEKEISKIIADKSLCPLKNHEGLCGVKTNDAICQICNETAKKIVNLVTNKNSNKIQ